MGQRIVAGLLGLALILPGILYGGAYAIAAIVALALLIGLDEYAGMAMPTRKNRARVVLVICAALVHGTAVFAPFWVLPACAVATMICLCVPMFLEEDVAAAGEQAVRLGFGAFYAPLMLAPIIWVRRESEGLPLIFLLLAVTWLGDTGAYFAGRFAGKTPLFPRISPKKTREGFVGGMLLSVIGACIVKAVGHLSFGWAEVVALAIVLDVAGVVGDLAESMLKRAWGVKDSGWIMPGHGGILDRIDSLLFSAPLLLAWLQMRQSFFA
jgi:phosphatidate cytidylyltransferase